MDNSTTPTPFQWDDEKITRLLTLKEAGLSASQIGAALGTTKGAISGKLRRLGLYTPHYKQRQARPTPFREPAKGKEHVARKRAVLAKNGNPHLPPGSVSLLDLRADDCRWPVTDRPPHLFCAEARWGSSPYCACHTAKAWRREL